MILQMLSEYRGITKTAGLVAILLSALAFWHYWALVRGNLVALLDLQYTRQSTPSLAAPVEARLVAHAGGAVRGLTYTNSREALDEHYAEGYRVFELDFHWTSDGRLVVVHDWRNASARFGTTTHVFSYDEFVSAKCRDGLHQLTFEQLREWLQTHEDAIVVTDTKDSNVRFLRYLQANAGDIRRQLIIQIYRVSELQLARQLGPRAVWLTVYKYDYPAWALSSISGVDAFVIPVASYDRYRNPLLMESVHFYVHSVPAHSVDDTFRRLPGIYGIYVD
jgi:glycerophosphoryl diester phosphodiesterase